jgi:hypothetical protein
MVPNDVAKMRHFIGAVSTRCIPAYTGPLVDGQLFEGIWAARSGADSLPRDKTITIRSHRYHTAARTYGDLAEEPHGRV